MVFVLSVLDHLQLDNVDLVVIREGVVEAGKEVLKGGLELLAGLVVLHLRWGCEGGRPLSANLLFPPRIQSKFQTSKA